MVPGAFCCVVARPSKGTTPLDNFQMYVKIGPVTTGLVDIDVLGQAGVIVDECGQRLTKWQSWVTSVWLVPLWLSGLGTQSKKK